MRAELRKFVVSTQQSPPGRAEVFRALWFYDKFSSVIRLTRIEHEVMSNAEGELRIASTAIRNRADLTNLSGNSVNFSLDHETFALMSAIFEVDTDVARPRVLLLGEDARVVKCKANVLDRSARHR